MRDRSLRHLDPLPAVDRWWSGVRPAPGALGPAATAGLPGAIGGVPDGMAAATVVGVNPIHGLYAAMAGRIIGGLSASTQRMVVTTTSAAALAAGSALAAVPASDRLGALFLLTVVAGLAMVVAGALRLSRFTGFVSHSVMTGFLTGVALNIALGQLADLAGVTVDGGTALARAIAVVLHPGAVDVPSLVAGCSAIATLLLLRGTRFESTSAVLALSVTGIGVWLADATSVALVADVGEIPRGLPLPTLPSLGHLSVELVLGAVAVAVILLVQGAGVADASPNSDGSRSDGDRDFVAQGLANVGAGLLRGMPVGGSVGQTAINIGAGARDRWGAIASGAWILVVLVALSGLVSRVPMPGLAAVLVVASLSSLSPARLTGVWRAGVQSQIVLVTTLAATLVLPVVAAVGIGAAISLLLQVNRESLDLRVVKLVPRDDGTFLEQPAPARLPDAHATLLDVYGSLFYAGAKTLEAKLPDPGSSREPVVVLRLRGRASLGATAFTVLSRYAVELDAAGGRLYLSGVDPALARRFDRVMGMQVHERVRLHEAEPVVGASTRAARREAEAWLLRAHPDLAEPAAVHRASPVSRLASRARAVIRRWGS